MRAVCNGAQTLHARAPARPPRPRCPVPQLGPAPPTRVPASHTGPGASPHLPPCEAPKRPGPSRRPAAGHRGQGEDQAPTHPAPSPKAPCGQCRVLGREGAAGEEAAGRGPVLTKNGGFSSSCPQQNWCAWEGRGSSADGPELRGRPGRVLELSQGPPTDAPPPPRACSGPVAAGSWGSPGKARLRGPCSGDMGPF